MEAAVCIINGFQSYFHSTLWHLVHLFSLLFNLLAQLTNVTLWTIKFYARAERDTRLTMTMRKIVSTSTNARITMAGMLNFWWRCHVGKVSVWLSVWRWGRMWWEIRKIKTRVSIVICHSFVELSKYWELVDILSELWYLRISTMLPNKHFLEHIHTDVLSQPLQTDSNSSTIKSVSFPV